MPRADCPEHGAKLTTVLGGGQLLTLGAPVKPEERCWKVWVRVILGGKRRIDVARAYGYRDGSAITQILKRLAQSSETDKAQKARRKALQIEWEGIVSSVKS